MIALKLLLAGLVLTALAAAQARLTHSLVEKRLAFSTMYCATKDGGG